MSNDKKIDWDSVDRETLITTLIGYADLVFHDRVCGEFDSVEEMLIDDFEKRINEKK